MATIGQSLPNPENGWIRYDDINEKIKYIGTWVTATNSSYHNGSIQYTNESNGRIEFEFYGTKLTLMNAGYNNRSTNVEVIIDGVSQGKFSQYVSSAKYQYVFFTIENLERKNHSVVIKNGSARLDLDCIDIDSDGILGRNSEKKMIIKNPLTNQYYSLIDKILIYLPNNSTENIILHGIEASKEVHLNTFFDKIRTVIENEDGTQTITDKIVEPFTIYDEFGESIEALYFTDDETVSEADLILEANWSPIDELEGDFEVVTWSDEDKTTAQRILEMTATPTPKFISPTTVTNIIGDLQGLNIQGDGKFLLTHNNSQWFKWSGTDFVTVNVQNVNTEGMSSQEITSADYSKWIYDKINIGVFIENNEVINHMGINQLLPNKTSQLSNINFYILNTTARIDLELAGLSLTGSLSDADLTRVQYKVTLNGEPFFPKNGEWTTLSEPPQNINITMKTSDIKMMDWNTLRVDFKDFFGTEDYWQTTFVGNYASLMFKDIDGNYYSDDVGQVLQYLDFGNIVAGEVTVSHEIILKNQYGYAVKDIEIVPNTSYLPEGVLIEMSKTNDPFIPESDLIYTEGLADNEELSFFVRMNTDVNSIPNEHNKFDVFVKASRKGV